MISTNVVIVGAGPSGSAAAIELARAGRSVTMIDKAVFPRDKICGDGLTTGALRILERLGFEPEHQPDWMPVNDVVVRSFSGRIVELPMPREPGQYVAVLPRLQLDDALADLARKAGATLLEGEGLAEVDERGDGVRITTTEGTEIHADYAIAADGMWSPLRKKLGLNTPGYLGEIHAFRQYFSNVSAPASEKLIVWFEPDILPGYIWSFPLPGNRANVGFGIRRGHGIETQEMKRLWPDLLSRPQVQELLGADATPEGDHRAWPLPARIPDAALVSQRTLLVGDAASAIDPMTGEGIAQAMLTGIRAAEAIVGGSNPAAVRSRYERTVRADLVADHRMSSWLSNILAHERGCRGALRAADTNDWTRRNFARWMFEDYPRAMIMTPKRWHRGMFTGPGAYRPGR